MNRKQHKWAGFRAPKLRICTPDIIDHMVLHRRHSPPKTSSTDTIRSGRACQKPLLPASSPPKSDDQNSQKSFNNSQLGPGIPSMSTFCGQYSLEKNFLIVRSQVFRTFQISRLFLALFFSFSYEMFVKVSSTRAAPSAGAYSNSLLLDI